MKIFNTLTGKKEELKTVEEGVVRIYACGPTVYNLIHIGNARPLCVFDVLHRYLDWRGWDVRFVQNFTDIDDKIINRANEEGVTYDVIAQRYIDEFWKDAQGLNILRATEHPRATENIDEIIAIISELIEKDYAYATPDGDVYFRTGKFSEYGKLSNQPLEDLKSGARIDVSEIKEDAMDFALWKAAKAGEPFWTSPWGNGRPGWHIECSAMARRYLGKTIDIHGGGQDLIFPHHENEIAQSECCNGVPFARYWMHNGFISIDNKKMSKSLGNFFTVRDVAEKYGYEPIRFFLISSSYCSPINYSIEIIEQSISALDRLYTCRQNLEFSLKNAQPDGTAEDGAVLEILEERRRQFIESMEDDLNTADAIAALFELVRDINVATATSASPSKKVCEKSLALFNELTGVLGILYDRKQAEPDSEIEALIEKRSQARQQKNWAESDRIRDELKGMGVILEDTPQGVKWHRG
ncbi:MAG: cysteine--tRNA ligase [Oscillospiraceae bacterium]|nr:cysteine--tRNA ligase [Oscillospiraceae bacterium]MDD4413994.1 cysteine--tRNA ligase [Oscillospiraceae bacterium]